MSTGNTPPDEAAPGDDTLLGTTLGNFKITRLLGRGGMGRVYLGEQPAIGSRVAIKVLHEHLASSPSLVQRFYAEARAVNVIGHENIVSIFDMSMAPPQRYYFVMEYLDGQPLNDLMRGPMNPKRAIPILVQVCDGLQAAHLRGVVHRDLKPENIFVIKRGRQDDVVKILDFGIAKLFSTELAAEQTSAGTIVGTPEYMSPEQANGEPIDGRADLYALGVIAYAMATGKLPFSGGGFTGMLMQHKEKVAPAPHVLEPSVPKAWSDVIMRALAKKPQERFTDAISMGNALERVLSANPPSDTVHFGSSRPAEALPLHKTPIGKRLTPQPARPSTPLPTRVPTPPPFRREVTASSLDGKTHWSNVPYQDLSKAGAFMCTLATLPPLMTRLKLRFHHALRLEFLAEVVRHVTPEQAKSWSMSIGFGVQFVDLKPEHKEGIAKLMASKVVDGGEPAAPQWEPDDASAQKSLDPWVKRAQADHYVVLGLEADADFEKVRTRGRELKRELETLGAKPMSSKQKAQVKQVVDRIQQALDVLAVAAARLEYDGQRGNFRGVARCIWAGLTVTDIELVRKRLLSRQPGAEASAQVQLLTAKAWEAEGTVSKALTAYETALAADPLNVILQTKYWALKKRPAASTK
jgi:serine/threonine-protein kinase